MNKIINVSVTLEKEYSRINKLDFMYRTVRRTFSDMNNLSYSTLNTSYFLIENKSKRIFISNNPLRVVI